MSGNETTVKTEEKSLAASAGSYIRQLREERKISIMTLAGLCAVMPRTIQEIETAATLRPARRTLLVILQGLSSIKRLSVDERKKVLEPLGYRDQSLLPDDEESASIAQKWEQSVFELPHPVYLVDFAHRLLAWNRYIPRLIGLNYGHPALEPMRRKTLYDLIFNKQFDSAFAIANKESFLPEMLYVMRCEFEPFKEDAWCKDCIKEARDNYPEFRMLWDKVQKMPIQELGLRTMGPIQIQPQGSALLSFHLLGTDFVNDSRFRVIQYLPANATTMRQCLEWVESEETKG
jgi:transcriptional regulator with XRE-family HTH domain